VSAGRPGELGTMGLDEQLGHARGGTEFFGRKLAELADGDFDGPSPNPGWTRRHVVAHVGYNARGVGRLAQWASTGEVTPMYPSPTARNDEIEAGTALSPGELRALFAETAAALDDQWRALPPDAWAVPVRTSAGRILPASETVWMRTREVWVHAIDLGNGASMGDLPAPVLRRLLEDITASWAERGEGANLVLQVDGTGEVIEVAGPASPEAEVVSGDWPGLVEWATGRGRAGVRSSLGPAPGAPRWL
jgi:maleylpyruvate isomerase